MIYDRIENIDLYNIDKNAVEFIKNLSSGIECKKHLLDGGVYANVEEYTTRKEGFFEAHQNYIDVQLLLKGEEIIECTPVNSLKVKETYNPERDIAFYYDNTAPQNTCTNVTKVKLSSGFFTVLYPHEAHKPQMTVSVPEKVKKVVVKIPAV